VIHHGGPGSTPKAPGEKMQHDISPHRVVYDAQDLLDELSASLADRSTARLLKRLSRLQPLVIDKVDNLTVKPDQANTFFRLIDQRYNRVSTIITTSLDLTDWHQLFEKKHLVDALLDRLRHRCITISFDGPSCEWQFVIPNAHLGYVNWDRFEANQRRLADNAQAFGGERRAGQVREGGSPPFSARLQCATEQDVSRQRRVRNAENPDHHRSRATRRTLDP
jgi:hypothetical protein